MNFDDYFDNHIYNFAYTFDPEALKYAKKHSALYPKKKNTDGFTVDNIDNALPYGIEFFKFKTHFEDGFLVYNNNDFYYLLHDAHIDFKNNIILSNELVGSSSPLSYSHEYNERYFDRRASFMEYMKNQFGSTVHVLPSNDDFHIQIRHVYVDLLEEKYKFECYIKEHKIEDSAIVRSLGIIGQKNGNQLEQEIYALEDTVSRFDSCRSNLIAIFIDYMKCKLACEEVSGIEDDGLNVMGMLGIGDGNFNTKISDPETIMMLKLASKHVQFVALTPNLNLKTVDDFLV